MKIPTKINPDTIIEAVVDLRFNLQSNISSSALLGMLYTKLKDNYAAPKSLPINQIPEVIRDSEPNLRFKPTEQIESDNFIIQLGKGVLVLINKTTKNSYVGKDKFLGEVAKTLEWFTENAPIKNYTRLGIRYIDFFSFNIFDESELKATLVGEPLNKVGLNMNILDEGDFKKTLQVTNNGIINKNNKVLQGSIIDIDTYRDLPEGFEKDLDISELLSKAHTEGKELFFKVLGDNLVKNKLNPTYE